MQRALLITALFVTASCQSQSAAIEPAPPEVAPIQAEPHDFSGVAQSARILSRPDLELDEISARALTQRCPNLQHLDFKSLTPQALTVLLQLPLLISLHVNIDAATEVPADFNFTGDAPLSELLSVDINNFPAASLNSFLAQLLPSPKLESLAIWNVHTDDTHIATIVQQTPLKQLYLNYPSKATNAGLDALSKLENLHQLHYGPSATSYTAEGMQVMFPGCYQLYFDGSPVGD